jgi:hypothetical protein
VPSSRSHANSLRFEKMKVVGEKLFLELTWVMSSRHNSATRLFLILAFACAIVFAPAATFARDTYRGGRLIVQRAADFGTGLAVHLWIDGIDVANIIRDRRFDGFVPAGHHVLTVLAVPNSEFRPPTSIRLNVQPGHTYVFTAVWESDRIVLR